MLSNHLLFFKTHVGERAGEIPGVPLSAGELAAKIPCKITKVPGRVIIFPFLWVRKDFICLSDFLKLWIAFVTTVIRVMYLGQFVISPLYLCIICVLGDPQNQIVILCCIKLSIIEGSSVLKKESWSEDTFQNIFNHVLQLYLSFYIIRIGNYPQFWELPFSILIIIFIGHFNLFVSLLFSLVTYCHTVISLSITSELCIL